MKNACCRLNETLDGLKEFANALVTIAGAALIIIGGLSCASWVYEKYQLNQDRKECFYALSSDVGFPRPGRWCYDK